MHNRFDHRQKNKPYVCGFILPSCHLLAHMVSIIHNGRAASSMAMTSVGKKRAP